MPLDRDTVSRWLEAYVRAWETYDPHAIGELFAEDATYAWHPGTQATRSPAVAMRSSRHGSKTATHPARTRASTLRWRLTATWQSLRVGRSTSMPVVRCCATSTTVS